MGAVMQSLGRGHQGAIDLHRDAPPQEVYRKDEQALLQVHADKDALDIGHRATCDSDALALTEIRVWKDGKTDAQQCLNCFYFPVGDDRQLIPALAEHADQSPHLADLEVACLVHGVVQEEIAGKHGAWGEAPGTELSGPHADLGQKDVKTLGGELVMYQMLAVAMRPENVPRRLILTVPRGNWTVIGR